MFRYVQAVRMLLANIMVATMPIQDATPLGVTIEGDVLVKWPVEHKGKVIIPDGVRHIARYAFRDCKDITDVAFPSGILTIGEGAFSRCFGLTEISIPESVTNIGNAAFFLCWNLTNLVINANVRDIPQAMCLRCVRLEGVVLPKNLLDLGRESFLSCRSLKTIEIPESVTNISEKAFGGCARLEKIVLPRGVKSLGDNAFAGCYDLHSADMPSSLDVSSSEMFKDSTMLRKSITDTSVCGLDMILRAATDEFISEGYPCRVDIFALDRFVAHIYEIKTGMMFSEVDEFARRYGITYSHGAQVGADGRVIRTSTRLMFHMSRRGSVNICLKYKDNIVNEIVLSEAFKLACKAGIAKSPNIINRDVKRWLE